MSNTFESIKRGLNEALLHAKGHDNGIKLRQIEVPDTDIIAIRAKSGLSQTEFARSIGVAVGTLRGWEQGRRRPEGPARVLLALIDKKPAIVREMLKVS